MLMQEKPTDSDGYRDRRSISSCRQAYDGLRIAKSGHVSAMVLGVV